MKCPVCDGIIENTARQCTKCGFADLRTEFINENELEMWRTYVVYPCRFAYQTSVAQTKEIEGRFKKALAAVRNAQKDLQESECSNNDSVPFFKKLPLDKSAGWITKGNVTYKNFYECKNGKWTTCEISNIVLNIIGNKMTADFFVKKSFDYDGADSTYFIAFKWKLKDDYGIVVADGRWSNDRMQVGDVTKASISISGLDPSVKYVLELANY